VPFWHGQKLLYTVPPYCRTKPLFIDGMGHNHVNVSLRPLVASKILDFLCTCVLTNVSKDIQRGNYDRLPTLSDTQLSEITYPTQAYQESISIKSSKAGIVQ
jgi:hypothetical protein